MPQPDRPAKGAITGRISYPSESIHVMRVVTLRLSDNQRFFVNKQLNDGFYILPVPKGAYHIAPYVCGMESNSKNLAGGYSQAVRCRLLVDCIDHSLTDVVVEKGSVIAGIDPGDFYTPAGSFPPAL